MMRIRDRGVYLRYAELARDIAIRYNRIRRRIEGIRRHADTLDNPRTRYIVRRNADELERFNERLMMGSKYGRIEFSDSDVRIRFYFNKNGYVNGYKVYIPRQLGEVLQALMCSFCVEAPII